MLQEVSSKGLYLLLGFMDRRVKPGDDVLDRSRGASAPEFCASGTPTRK
jgi:hypothetical protein